MEYLGKEILKCSEIKVSELFDDLQPLEGPELNEIITDMGVNLYNPLFPIGIWRTETNGQTEDIVFDGHRRLHAAGLVGITEIPAEIFTFKNFDEVFEMAIKTIGSKRDRNDFSIYVAVRKLRRLNNAGYATGYGRERDRLSRLLGANPQKIQYTFALLEYLDNNMILEEKFIEYIKNRSINFVYNRYLKQEKTNEEQEQKAENENDTAEDTAESNNEPNIPKVEVRIIHGENVEEHAFKVKNIEFVKEKVLNFLKKVEVA